MKRIIFIMAAALCLAACNQNEPNQPIDPQNWSPVGKTYVLPAMIYDAKFDTIERLYFIGTDTTCEDEELRNSTNVMKYYRKISGGWREKLYLFSINYPNIVFYEGLNSSGVIDTLYQGHFSDTLLLHLDENEHTLNREFVFDYLH